MFDVVDVAELFAAGGCSGSLHAVRMSDGAEVGHDADRLRVMASVVKVPIALEFYAQVAAGGLDPAAPITLLPSRRTAGPVGISRFRDPATVSLRDLAYLMLTISDNAATDALTDAVGVEAVNDRLQAAGCVQTVVVGDLRSMLDGVATDLGLSDYTELLAAQRGALGPQSQAAATDAGRIDRCRALDPSIATRTTAREATRLLAAIWADTAAPNEACTTLRSVMAEQVTRRLGIVVLNGGSIAAKSGALFGRVRNEIGVVSDPDGEDYAVAVLTHAHAPFARHHEINATMATTAKAALDELRDQ